MANKGQKKTNKKAQVALFVIIAIILVAGISSYFLFKNQGEKKVDANAQEVYNYIQSCIDNSLIGGLTFVSLSGGYIIPPEQSVMTDSAVISYWAYNGTDISPDISEIENELNNYVEVLTLLCTNFSKFPLLTIEEGNISAKTKIEAEKTSVELNWPLIIKKADKTYNIEKPYISSEPVRLGRIYEFTNGVVARKVLAPEETPLSYITSTFNMAYMNVTILPYDDSSIYIITDLQKENQLANSPYIFMFATQP